MPRYEFPDHGRFRDRSAELERVRRWWEDGSDPFPLVVYGRRRTGKTWLLREFAHGRDADIFVCDSRAEGDQLSYFARVLEGSVGVRPDIADIRSFYELLFRQATSKRRLAVIDEFPMLLAAGSPADSTLAATLDEMAGTSRLKLVVCGSQVSTMESLLAERAPLHGRGTTLLLQPLRFEEALAFLPALPHAELVTRYAIAGGMPLYLRRLGRRGSLEAIVCEDVLSPLGPFFEEVRDVLNMELTSTATYFSLLAALAEAPSLPWDELVARSRVEESVASRYIRTLEDLRIVQAANPIFAPPKARRRRYRLADPFMRFWFRFVFPYQSELAAGMRPTDHFERSIEPFLGEHVAPVFEDICRSWVRKTYGGATDTVGAWWGLARHDLRRKKIRSTEEIDVVGARGTRVTVAGECRWRRGPMPREVLDHLREDKLPALGQTGVDISSVRVVLFSRGGFGRGLIEEARRGSVELVDLARLVEDLGS
jgi:AAA+ ATPase superfamily predicted ATPase